MPDSNDTDAVAVPLDVDVGDDLSSSLLVLVTRLEELLRKLRMRDTCAWNLAELILMSGGFAFAVLLEVGLGLRLEERDLGDACSAIASLRRSFARASLAAMSCRNKYIHVKCQNTNAKFQISQEKKACRNTKQQQHQVQ